MSGELVGWLAAVVGTLLGLPQVIRLLRIRDTAGLSVVAWQAILGLNIGWMVHGLVIGQVNLVVPNLVGMFCTSIVLWFLAADHGRPLYRIALPGLWVGAGMIATDLLFGSAVYGVIAVLPAVVANVGGSVELVRAPSVIGVSPVALIGNVLNQLLWSVWGLLVSDSGTIIAAGVTLVIALFNQVWWILRRLGLRPLLVRPGVYVEAS